MRQDLFALAELKSLTKRLGRTEVLRDLDLAIGAGEVTALLRQNGADKTTAVGLLTGRLQPDRGTARLFGFDPSRPAGRARKRSDAAGFGAARHAECQGIGYASFGFIRTHDPLRRPLRSLVLASLPRAVAVRWRAARPS
jgi:ABC-type multidrug transport system ATPase subunit